MSWSDETVRDLQIENQGLREEVARLQATLDGDPEQLFTPEHHRAWRQSAIRYADKVEAELTSKNFLIVELEDNLRRSREVVQEQGETIDKLRSSLDEQYIENERLKELHQTGQKLTQSDLRRAVKHVVMKSIPHPRLTREERHLYNQASKTLATWLQEETEPFTLPPPIVS